MRLDAFNIGNRFPRVLRGPNLMKSFVHREDGTITTFALLIFVLMVAVGGIAVDIMRYETQRAQLQYTLDRAVLAAASVTQPLNPVDVVENYFDVSGLQNYRLNVNVDQGVNYRRVNAYAELEINTLFMHMFGVRVLTSPAEGAAEEIIPNVEVSLVLDVSGSMRFNDEDGMPRIDRLRPAARSFVTRVLEGDRFETTTISIVPYAGQVNPGSAIFNSAGGTRMYVEYQDADGNTVTELRDHPRSSCIELDTSDFSSPAIPQGGSFAQVPHFHNWAIDNPTMDWGWCPLEGDSSVGENSSAIYYLSNSETVLHNYIDRMRLHDGTGTHYGMLWGMWLLDPGSNWAVQQLSSAGIVPAEFNDRPATYDDPETLKVVVLMTDGNITDQIRPNFIDRTQAPISATDTGDIFLNHTEELAHQSSSGDCNGQGCRTTSSYRNQNLQNFYAACDTARANDIIVFTIAFDAGSNGETEMRNCASSPAHYYDVRGSELDAAFQSIAGAINQLRLIQ
ncbi:pilus assembly protein TadG-related protein [Roseibacterium sp. SDUM158017]|uniref:Tad domain-containing protein n=1 Tax=Roseicyclus salinarum TaxID=3036773 RepID=UPI002414F4A6|nr:Tad domain-containing protein [Roseibacterium sp. SDUM158017]MDG4647415.1 pilus assembly protein TadG-related protein [Roseibacterium sp. SDUM158017]